MVSLILVGYLERNKILKINSVVGQSDLVLLEKEFKKEFNYQSNVNLVFVKLDHGCTLANKDKLKAVVAPLLQSPPSTENVVESRPRTESDVSVHFCVL